MTPDMKLLRWHWRVNTRLPEAAQIEFHLDDLHTPADPDRFLPEGHQLTLTWQDPQYPAHLGERRREKFVTEQFRADAIRQPFWTEQITGSLSITVGLAKPERELGDDMQADRVFRVSYSKGGDEWLVAPVVPASPDFSRIVAVEPV
jgi:hypothetical protein